MANTEAQRIQEFLHGIQLDQFYRRIVDKLHVTRLNHFAHVTDQDLNDLGMSKPEQRRLFEALKKSKKRALFGSLRRKKSKTKLFSPEPDAEEPTQLPTDQLQIPELQNHESHPSSHSSSLTCVIDEKDLALHQMLGTGAFGYVRKGEWIGHKNKKVDVAVKCLKISKDLAFLQLQLDFTKEANGMSCLDHPHIIKLYGVVLSTPIMLVTELAPLGCLLTCLRDENPKFLVSQLCDFVIQVASGMSYLESQHYIHRDLAARNLLLSSYDTIKIGDFGLMRPLGTEDNYYTMNPKGKVPFAWCPPESLKFRKFSHASDMWSFGILLMELFSYGEEPWPGLNCAQILQKVDQPKLERPQKPSHCPSKIYNVVYNHCWAHDPTHRPTFPAIQNIMEQIRPKDVKAKRTFDSKTPQNLSFIEGDGVTLIEASPDASWWRGQNKRTARVGMFPSELVNDQPGSFSPTIIRSASFDTQNIRSPKSPISCTPRKQNCDCGENHLYDLPFVVSSPKAISPTRSIDSELTLSTESGYSSSFSSRSNSECSRSQASYENCTGIPNYELMEPKVKTKPTRPPPIPGDESLDVRPTSPISVNNQQTAEEPIQNLSSQQEKASKHWSSGDKPRSTGPFTLSRRVSAKKLKSFDIPIKKTISASTTSNTKVDNDSQSYVSSKLSPLSTRRRYSGDSPQTSPIERPKSEVSQVSPTRISARTFPRRSSDGFASRSLKLAEQQANSPSPAEIRLSNDLGVRRSCSFSSSSGHGGENTELYENHEYIPRSKSISVGYGSNRPYPFYENHEIINAFKTTFISSMVSNTDDPISQQELSACHQKSPRNIPQEYEKMIFQQSSIKEERNFSDKIAPKAAYYENVPTESQSYENFIVIEHSDVPEDIGATASNLKCPSYENHGFEELTIQAKKDLDKERNVCDPFQEHSSSLPNSSNWEVVKEHLDESGGLVIALGRSITPTIRRTSSDGDLRDLDNIIYGDNLDHCPGDPFEFKDKPDEATFSVDITGELANVLSTRIKESVAITNDGVILIETHDNISRAAPEEPHLSSLQDRDLELSNQVDSYVISQAVDDVSPPLLEKKRQSILQGAENDCRNMSYENLRKSSESSPIPVSKSQNELPEGEMQEEIWTKPTRPNVLSFENKLAAFSLPLSQSTMPLAREDHMQEDAPVLPPKEKYVLRSPGKSTTSHYPRLSRHSSDVKLTFTEDTQRYRPCPTKGTPNYEYPLGNSSSDDDIPPPLPKKLSKSSPGGRPDLTCS